MRWMDSTEEAICVSEQELSRAAEDKTLWTSLIHRVTRSWSQFNGTFHRGMAHLCSGTLGAAVQMTTMAGSRNQLEVVWHVSLYLLILSTWQLGSPHCMAAPG